MTADSKTQIDSLVSPNFTAGDSASGLSLMAKRMVGSSILKIAWEIRAIKEQGVPLADMTVGDFSPEQFPLPDALRDAITNAMNQGLTNYPPPNGMPELREAIQAHIRRTQNLDYPLDAITVVSGGRPSLYATYRLLVDPGELVLFPTPSWNNHNYRDVCDVRVRAVPCGPETAFQPTAAAMEPHLGGARLLVLNTPQNPSGGVMAKEEVEAFGHLLVRENTARAQRSEKPLYLLFDQIYSSMTFDGHRHYSPVELVPDCAPWVVHSDGISKGFCATGLRLGWFFGPPSIIGKAVALLTHVGAWAPKPVQLGTANFLNQTDAVAAWDADLARRIRERLQILSDGMAALKKSGFDVDYIEPQGAIYMSLRFPLIGRTTPEGHTLKDHEDIRSYLLHAAGVALVPFDAFGVEEADGGGWFRASVGAASIDELNAAFPRLHDALAALH
ncbi:MAG: aminotransferase class I/II-fold pyridoxal phosphate-dependent enzyme [Planctomycetes bacterium]|nr:aminotransferase class I/II-fold pyridoxal phosphate-dependent enzyme [Planctomycetota bacterium]MBT4028878.1 aminotransferase class I/II-fold pyridoxal phosphate-dependent enzyme [Planctomycetota bacterium]MBT4559562.1 aminotransferase class I/II-fold pyridoxal phosphate-dependent enzyme [Planctomycetota bacterium]MBT5101294.1 aminotransferase class I/II-fold pyridoxal phosphate-dependent enzyme [Planctomycetota bacterium]MBT7318912.1 aminotransferase class I/II-fold pyridoxal phosphate-dep